MFGSRKIREKNRPPAAAEIAPSWTVAITSNTNAHESESILVSSASARYETISAADFERAMRLGTEASESSSGLTKTRYESAAVDSPRRGNLPTRYETESKSSVKPEVPPKRIDTEAVVNYNVSPSAVSGVSLTEEPSMQRQLVLFQQEEALNLWKTEDYKAVEAIIIDILQSTALTEHERVIWELRHATTMQYQGRWKESLEILEGGRKCPVDDGGHGEILRMTAEANYQLQEFEIARNLGVKALEALQPAASKNAEHTLSFHQCIEMMARIANATGRQVESRFYRSKVVEGHVDQGHLSQLKRDSEKSYPEAPKTQSELQQAPGSGKSLAKLPEDVARYLEEYGVSCVNGKASAHDLAYMAALDAAMRSGNTRATEFLVSVYEAVSADWQDEDETVLQRNDIAGRTPLYYAIQHGKLGVVINLLDRGAKIHERYPGRPVDQDQTDMRPGEFHFPLDVAVHYYGVHKICLEIVKALLVYGAKCDTGFVHPPLVVAVEHGYNDIVELLLSRGAKLTVRHFGLFSGVTMLHLAARSKLANAKTIELLCSAGANVNSAQSNRETPLHVAVTNGNEAIVKALCSSGANLRVRDSSGWTPLHVAAALCEKEIASVLYRNGANINALDNAGWTPLHHAANSFRSMRSETIAFLCNLGADVNAQNADRNTALHFVAGEGYTTSVRVLCKHNANVNITNKKGETPLDCARMQLTPSDGVIGRRAAIRVLLDYGGEFKAYLPSPDELAALKSQK